MDSTVIVGKMVIQKTVKNVLETLHKELSTNNLGIYALHAIQLLSSKRKMGFAIHAFKNATKDIIWLKDIRCLNAIAKNADDSNYY